MQLVDQAKELYFTSHRFLRACQKAITCNSAIWRQFQAGYLLGGSGVALGAGIAATTVRKGIQSGVSSLAPERAAMGVLGVAVSVALLGYGAFELWKTQQYDSICESCESNAPPPHTLCRCRTNHVWVSNVSVHSWRVPCNNPSYYVFL